MGAGGSPHDSGIATLSISCSALGWMFACPCVAKRRMRSSMNRSVSTGIRGSLGNERRQDLPIRFHSTRQRFSNWLYACRSESRHAKEASLAARISFGLTISSRPPVTPLNKTARQLLTRTSFGIFPRSLMYLLGMCCKSRHYPHRGHSWKGGPFVRHHFQFVGVVHRGQLGVADLLRAR